MQLPLKTEGGRKEAQTTQKLNFIKRFFCDFCAFLGPIAWVLPTGNVAESAG
jgi:hypothetical protein